MAPRTAYHLGNLTELPLPPIFVDPFEPPLTYINGTYEIDQQRLEQIVAEEHERIFLTRLLSLVGYAAMFILTLAVVLYLRYNRHAIYSGSSKSAEKLLLPAYEPALLLLSLVSAGFCVYFVSQLLVESAVESQSLVKVEVVYSGREFVVLFIVILLFEKSLALPALRRTVLLTALCSSHSVLLVWCLVEFGDKSNGHTYYWVLNMMRLLVVFIYIAILIRPPARASKRTLREYSAFGISYHVLVFIDNELFRHGLFDAAVSMQYGIIVWSSLAPFFMWRVLLADTKHWRGLGRSALDFQLILRQRQQDKIHERISSQGFHVLIEMHRKYIVDFAFLEFQHQIGTGSNALVYSGMLYSKTPVAIKVYTPTTLTEETIADFSHEAALCGALTHPNIVQFHGLCVCPPTVCLITELCMGNLDDIMCAMVSRPHHMCRQQFLINISYMIDAARAVAYLHSFSPPFIHRDIKPSNFLVDSNYNIKLTDFGESRALPKNPNEPKDVRSKKARFRRRMMMRKQTTANAVPELPTTSPNLDFQPAISVKGTADYMAPEVIKGKAGLATYAEAADVYSLAITMWDILYPGCEKYPAILERPSTRNHLAIYEAVIAGKRPALAADMHPSLRQVVESGWHADPRMRPSAQNIVQVLESIQEETYAVFALEVCEDLAQAHQQAGGPAGLKLYTGEQICARMEALGFITEIAEGVRLGNGLMDAGLLHHVKHASSFEANGRLYFFDEDNIQLNQPFVIMEEGGRGARTVEQGRTQGVVHDHGSDLTGQVEGRHDRSSSLPKRARSSASKSSAQSSSAVHDSELQVSDMRGVAVQQGGVRFCSCQALGQRLTEKQTMRSRFRIRRREPVEENHHLTTQLLSFEEDGGNYVAVSSGEAA